MITDQALKDAIKNLVKIANNPTSTEEEIKTADKKFAKTFEDVWDTSASRIA